MRERPTTTGTAAIKQSMSVTKCILSVTFVAAILPSIASFPIIVPTTSHYGQMLATTSSSNNPKNHHHHHTSTNRFQLQMSSERSSEAAEEEQKAYDSLYEFLTKRPGAPEPRERKRDRLRKWVTKSSSSGSTSESPDGGSRMVQPLSVQDGSVMEDVDTNVGEPTRLNRVWSAMPTLEELLSKRKPKDKKKTKKEPANTKTNDAWFEMEKQQIKAEYDAILQDMKQKIAQQRLADPESVPDNSEAIAESVVSQELKRMLNSVKISRAKERLQDEEIQRKRDLEGRDWMRDNDDAIAKRLLQEAADDWKRQEALKQTKEDFEQYERHAKENLGDDMNIPQPGADLDAWALERLEDMLEKTAQEGTDVSISDILEENIETLQERLEKASQKGALESSPQTMKEWQMYRAIATRLNQRRIQENSGIPNPLLNQDEVDEQLIQQQLNQWREYIGKEKQIRERSGLTAGPKMPFDFHQGKSQGTFTTSPLPDEPKKSKNEIRRQVNLQAIEAMEDLIRTSDPKRAENLQKQLTALKEELEPLDYLDKEVDNELEDEFAGPLDLSDFFRSESEDLETRIEPAFDESEQESINQMMSGQDYAVEPPRQQQQESPKTPFFMEDDDPIPEPPKTPFFEDTYSDEPKPPAPSTPFFAAGDDTADSSGFVAPTDSKLGNAEEQKLTNMFRKAGARTKEEQDTIRAEWEAFQEFEKSKRDASGLSSSDDEALLETNLKFNVSEVMTGDGDVDAAKILASIGPRPTRRKKSEDSAVDPSEISDAMYRSVSAVGGGKSKDDPSIRDKEKAEFEDYMRKEEEMRQSLDEIDENASKVASEGVPMYDENYAENALASMERPVFKRSNRKIDEKEYSDKGGVLYSEGDSLSDMSDSEDDEVEDDAMDDLIPNWLKKEREDMGRKQGSAEKDTYFSGSKMDDVFDDDKYEHNLRQLAEYKHRRAGNKQQMGIDISDVFIGRQQSDDYADYSYDADYFRGQQGGWGTANFEARKATLLDYVELSVAEVNNLFDHRESTFSNGASQYIPRINKPFSEFGAIFRLEGVMFDLTGIHDQVWAKVAQEFEFKVPLLEDIQRAAVARPDFSIRRIFCWSNDMMEVNKISDRFLAVFRETLDEWAVEQGLKVATEPSPPPKEQTRGFMALGEEEIGASQHEPQQSQQQPPPMFRDERTKMMKMKESWEKTATYYKVAAPSNEQIAQCSFLSPDIAIRDVFQWTADQTEIEQVVSYYSQLLAGVEPVDRQKNTAASDARALENENVLELQFSAWEKVARQASLQPPSPEEVLAASVLNDPRAVIAHGFGWTKDPAQIEELATQYRNVFAQMVNEGVHNRPYQSSEAPVPIEEPKQTNEPSSTGPKAEEILQSQIEAWNEVSREHGLLPPAHSQIELTMNLSAADAVRRLLAWSHNFNNDQIISITASYEKALQQSSSKLLNTYGLKAQQVNTNGSSQPTASKEVGADELFMAATDAWAKVADRKSFPAPSQEQVLFAMTVGPQQAIVSGFGWADNMSDAAKIAKEYREEIKLKRAAWHRAGMTTNAGPTNGATTEDSVPLVKVIPGVDAWIHSLHQVEMGCGVISHLEEDQVNLLLEYAGLSSLLPRANRVTKNQGYDRDSQQMLGASLRIERRPDHCVVFDSSPQANTATQEIDMRSVAMVGPYPRYELLSADTSAFSFDELTAMNVRRLFGERVYDQPMLEAAQKMETVKKTKTRFWDPED